MHTVLVTGASGFIGGCALRAFARIRGPEAVRCLVRTPHQAQLLQDQGFQVTVGDLNDPHLPRTLVDGCDVILHAAAFMSAGTRDDVFAVNVHATDRLAQAAAEAGVTRFVFLSSIEAYGDFADRTLTEDQPYRPVPHVYAQSKMLGEKVIAQRFHAVGRDGFTHLRPGMVYGPNSHYWTHRYLHMARTGRIRVLGDGGRIYPVHEDDLVDAITAAATRPQAAGQTFNLVHDEGLSWHDWARAHHNLTGTGRPQRRAVLPLRIADRLRRATGRPSDQALRSELRKARIPHEKARLHLSWSPQTFGEAIASCDPPVSDRMGLGCCPS